MTLACAPAGGSARSGRAESFQSDERLMKDVIFSLANVPGDCCHGQDVDKAAT